MATPDHHSAYEAAIRGPETCPRCDGYVVASNESGERYCCLNCGHRVYDSSGVQLGLSLEIPAATPRNIAPERRKELVEEFRLPPRNIAPGPYHGDSRRHRPRQENGAGGGGDGAGQGEPVQVSVSRRQPGVRHRAEGGARPGTQTSGRSRAGSERRSLIASQD